jgi:hypothetical protein
MRRDMSGAIGGCRARLNGGKSEINCYNQGDYAQNPSPRVNGLIEMFRHLRHSLAVAARINFPFADHRDIEKHNRLCGDLFEERC